MRRGSILTQPGRDPVDLDAVERRRRVVGLGRQHAHHLGGPAMRGAMLGRILQCGIVTAIPVLIGDVGVAGGNDRGGFIGGLDRAATRRDQADDYKGNNTHKYSNR